MVCQSFSIIEIFWVPALLYRGIYFRKSFLLAQAVHLHLGEGLLHGLELRFRKIDLKFVPRGLIMRDLLALGGRQAIIINEDAHTELSGKRTLTLISHRIRQRLSLRAR